MEKKRYINHQQQCKQSGITLVALVVTIIVLLILAGVTINLALGNNGIIEKATYASNTMANATKTETEEMKEVTKLIDEAVINLPSEYQRVEYIESTGTQYIDTNFKPTTDTKVKCILASEKMGTNQNIAYYGARTSPNDNTNFGFINFRETKKLRFDRGGYTYSGKSNIVEAGTFYEIIQDKNENYINGLKVSESNGNFSNVNYNIFIFGINENGTYLENSAWTKDKISFKLFQIYNNSSLARNFIPCYSTINVINANENQCTAGTIGMYDTVEGKFYTNNGTGEFLKGNDV